jgi:hypothetical protein
VNFQETSDTTVTCEWAATRTIGSLLVLQERRAVLTLLRAPEIGESVLIQLDDEASGEPPATLDGRCITASQNEWGESLVEVELSRVGVVGSTETLQAFLDRHRIVQGGEVTAQPMPDSPQFLWCVYELPEPPAVAEDEGRDTEVVSFAPVEEPKPLRGHRQTAPTPELFLPDEDEAAPWPEEPPGAPEVPGDPEVPVASQVPVDPETALPPAVAHRVNESVSFRLGRRKAMGTLLRLAETSLRVRTTTPPAVYDRLVVTMSTQSRAEPPLDLTCEVIRVHPPSEGQGHAIFDARVTVGHSAATMARLRRRVEEAVSAPAVDGGE